MGTISEEVYERGRKESVQVKGKITFEDGSSEYGTREIILGDPTYRIQGTVVAGYGFLPSEYFAPLER